ncbi:hypothetical protein F5148DRAFT_979802 [Russula earlei]|uniref:Uncharacterized protein n=1 Tax=Russula earlei TaxID=71964 RepID=A0ACC0UAF5_9AGAM|nr:hypothetical protein F5148DRAFT_979802 [Russula earlei]
MSTTSSPLITSVPLPSPERTAELHTSLSEIRARMAAAAAPSSSGRSPTLVAVSKYKPAVDVRACYDAGQRDFGENYAQELVEKAAVLPRDVRWHFIGTVQSNKAKALASIENLYAVQTLASAKVADALNRHRQADHAPLRVLIQLNTSAEEAKGGIDAGAEEQLARLATHVVRACPRLRLVGLMTIGAAGGGEEDFAKLRGARDRLARVLPDDGVWGEGEGEGAGGGRGGRLLLSMGMSDDFELALNAGADIVRVGTGIFGSRSAEEGRATY